MLNQNNREYTIPEVRTLQVSVENGYVLSAHGGATPTHSQGIVGGTENFNGYGNGFDGSSFN